MEVKRLIEEFFLKNYDELELYVKVNVPERSKAVIVIVHGICEHQGRYDYVAEYLNTQGFKIYRFDNRGHGLSKGERVFYSNREEIVDDVNVIVEQVLKDNPGLPVFLLGHSMGGYGVVSFGTKYPGKVNGFITSGALTRDTTGSLQRIPEGLDPLSYVENEFKEGICSDKAVIDDYIRDPLNEKKISVGIFYSIKDGHKWLKENVENFIDPILILHGAKDGIISEKDSRDFFSEIKSEDKSLFIYSSLYHEILNEPSRDKILGHITEWLNERI